MSKQVTKQPDEFDIYDFDHTIYKGDCSVDFYIFCLRQQLSLLKYLPYQFWHLVLFILKLESRSIFKGHFFVYLRGVDDAKQYVEQFWNGHYRNIRLWYKGLDHSRDIIVSASPEFILEPVFRKLKAHTLIATRIDLKTGMIEGNNCWGEEKVTRLRQILGEPKIRKAYTDSLLDMPLLLLAKERYIVRGDKISAL
jgi:phosphoserine phosphatase